MFFHGLDPFITKTFTFTDALHNSKRQTTLHTFSDQIDHNIISGTDRCGNGRCTILNQHLCITQPNVSTMGKTCNTYQVRKIFRLGINKHLHGEICTKLRNSKTAKLTASNILRADSQCLSSRKQRHNISLIQGNSPCADTGQVFQHTDHSRIIVTQYIKFQKISINGMIIKMCGNDIAVHIIGWMLDRCKLLDLLTHWKYDDTSRVLACGTANSSTPLYDSVNFTVSLMLTAFLIVVFHITESGFFRKGTNGSCLESLPLSKNNLCVSVGIGLILS